MRKILLVIFLAVSTLGFAQYEKNIDKLIENMTLEEKVGQMAQVTVDILMNKEMNKLDENQLRKGLLQYKIGSVLNTWNNVAHTPEEWHSVISKIQNYASKTRLAIPVVYGVDAIHGTTYTNGGILFPQQIAMAATFNRDLVRKGAEISAYETRAGSIPWNFSPVLDLGIDVRWARLWETYGEDPYLASEFAKEVVAGYQGNDRNKIGKYNVAACAKHFLGYSVPVSGKDRTPANIPDNVLREYHLPSFKAAIENGLVSVMVNSGLINGEPVHASYRLLTGLLKNELKFDGVIVTDWNDIENIYRRDKVAVSEKDAVRLAINAGIDMSMIPYDYKFCDYLTELVREGKVEMSRIDDAVRRILRMKYRLGLFEKPVENTDDYALFGSEKHARIAYESAAEAITLLKNRNGILPLSKNSRILVCGPNSRSMRSLNGGWSYSWLGDKTEQFTGMFNNIYEAVSKEFGEKNVIHSYGVEYNEKGKYWEEKESGINKTKELAKQCDYIVLCLGENSYTEKPGDLQDMYISDLQTKLALEMIQTGKPVILILNQGRPRIISKFEDKLSAVLMAYLPGNYGGDAIADILSGDVNPSGKLPFNYPRYPQSLINYWHKYSEEQVKNEGMYNYESDYSPQYEFGYGLSYTIFKYSNMVLSSSEISENQTLEVSVDVTNTGMVSGKETVLLYLSDLYASLAPDMKRLKGFKKISLNPGETANVKFAVTKEEMSFFNLDGKQVAEPGEFEIKIGDQKQKFTLVEGKARTFAKTNGTSFVVDGNPYNYIGVNFWYGAILGSKGEGGDRKRLIKELDLLKEAGMDNLRVLIGADGKSGVPTKVEPTLQLSPGVYNDTIFDGLDFLLSEMGKRNMKAVLYFTNSWEWSGGYGQYLNWAGKGKNPIPAVDGWPQYMDYVKQYAKCDECHQMLKKHITNVITRVNRYTGVKYTDDVTIFSWEIGNEPRAFSDENKPAFAAWLKDISAHIKSLDKNHMVTIGTEGKHGCEQDIKLFELTHSDANIDYLAMHIWPKNWGWLNIKDIKSSLDSSIIKTRAYMDEHIQVAKKLNKPIVLEEFGFPRDNHLYTLEDGVTFRNKYYSAIFEDILKASRDKTPLAGCNIWSWGGFGRPSSDNIFWQKGDDYTGDPAQEEQGLNSVFDTDTTVDVIRRFNNLISGNNKTGNLFLNLQKLTSKGIMVGHQDDEAYGHDWYGVDGRSDVLETAGDYPAVTGWEIGDLEKDLPVNLDSIYFTDMKKYIKRIHKRGGLNSISWHANNLATGKNAWDCAQDTVVKSILPGGIHHNQYKIWLDKLAVFFNDLKDDNGEYIPFIFRIFHEHTGSWFWWGARQCTPEQYKQLYIFTVKYLRDIKNVKHILWAYSTATVSSKEEFFERYPGDEWVDIIGFDTYLRLDKPESVTEHIKQTKLNLDIITDYAKSHGKIAILAETGLEGVVKPDYFTKILLPTIKDYEISYVLFWRNAWHPKLRLHFYVPYKGHKSEKDFRKFADNERILLNRDVKNLYE